MGRRTASVESLSSGRVGEAVRASGEPSLPEAVPGGGGTRVTVSIR